MFTTVASGGWGAPPPRPPMQTSGVCWLVLMRLGFFATVKFSSKFGDFLLYIQRRKCTNTLV